MNDFHAAVVDLLFPSYCTVCSKNVSIKENYLCADCIEKLHNYDSQCEVCASTLIDDICHFCEGRAVFFDKNMSLFAYNDHLQKIIYGLKFEKKERLALFFGKGAWDFIVSDEDLMHLIDNVVVVPVPMHRRKLRKRGFNQSELIAQELAKRGKLLMQKPLYVKRAQEAQKNMAYEDRFVNTIGQFAVKKRAQLKDKSILLVDDVFTTGATVNECARVLKKDGAHRVFSLTMGRTIIKKLENLR